MNYTNMNRQNYMDKEESPLVIIWEDLFEGLPQGKIRENAHPESYHMVRRENTYEEDATWQDQKKSLPKKV